MFEKEMLDQDLEQSFAEMASSLDLEAPDVVAPWGFMAVAAFTPGAQKEAADQSSSKLSSQDVNEIWKVVETYLNFASDVEIKSTQDSQAAIAEIVKGIQTVTTDPFYCVLPNDIYPVTHAAVPQQVKAVFQDFFDANIYKPKSKVKVIPQGAPWLVGPQIAAVTYSSEALEDAAEQLEAKSFGVLFKQYGTWKLSILTSDVIHYQGPTKMKSSAKG